MKNLMWKKIPIGQLTWISLISALAAIASALAAIAAACYASQAIAEPRFAVSFKQDTVNKFTVLNPPYSFRIYPLSEVFAYKDPPKTLTNNVLIANEGEVWAQNLRVSLRLKEPFIFVNVYFNEASQGTWRPTPDESTYRLVKLERLEPIAPEEKVRISFVSGVGGWFGVPISAGIPLDDPYGALGAVGAAYQSGLDKATSVGGLLNVFCLD